MIFSLRKLKTLLWFWLQQTENLKLERVCNGPLPDRLITFFDHLALGSNHLPLFILSFDLFFCFTCTLQSFILTGISWSRVTMFYSMNYSNSVILTQWGHLFYDSYICHCMLFVFADEARLILMMFTLTGGCGKKNYAWKKTDQAWSWPRKVCLRSMASSIFFLPKLFFTFFYIWIMVII